MQRAKWRVRQRKSDRRRIVSFALSNRWYEKWFLIKFVYVITLGSIHNTLSSIIIISSALFFGQVFGIVVVSISCQNVSVSAEFLGFRLIYQFGIPCSMFSPALELSFIRSQLVSRQLLDWFLARSLFHTLETKNRYLTHLNIWHWFKPLNWTETTAA